MTVEVGDLLEHLKSKVKSRKGDAQADIARRGEDRYQHRVIVQQGDDAVTTQAAKNLANKHPENTTLVKADPKTGKLQGLEQVPQGTGNVKVQVVGHGDVEGGKLGGVDASTVADHVKAVKTRLGEGTEVAKVTLVGCKTDCASKAGQPSLTQQVQTELAKQGTGVGELTGRNTYVRVDQEGHKHDAKAEDQGALPLSERRAAMTAKPPIAAKPTLPSAHTKASLDRHTQSAEVVQSTNRSEGAHTASADLTLRDYTLYRADGRTFEELKGKFPDGFTAWTPLGVGGARKLVSTFLGEKDTSGLPKHVVDKIGEWNNPKLNDLSTYIKYTKDKSTVWVSTAINTDAGGQSSGAPLYKISGKLYEFDIKGNVLIPLPNGRTSNLKPSLLLDAPTLSESKLIALNHGPLNDAEVSFLTPIPLSIVRPYAQR
ncbi:C80 family cysteine peptidase [Burkholderia ubonensis]|uniref:C80 family cysteine peptidase n=1 Tax=Burkholderia ubonensis TaxID=101571 RepID=UPI00075E320B|nr:C80 family cysteine peptidase [Burkholderia ubonensis]KVP50010.1 hypothetical protein WJ90_12495 [Burkholderia ubonensis]KVR41721.1 hypothetical protein WK16_12065 [Burkholderia ubonensis]KVW27548.1 hypothetical protein WK94_10350 [Burkholderia ubonensis]